MNGRSTTENKKNPHYDDDHNNERNNNYEKSWADVVKQQTEPHNNNNNNNNGKGSHTGSSSNNIVGSKTSEMKIRERKDTAAVNEDPKTRSVTTKGHVSPFFPFWNELHDDLLVHVFSFVANAPFENMNVPPSNTDPYGAMRTSTLTHVLPLVCTKFHRLAVGEGCNEFWKAALLRQLRNEAELWTHGLSDTLLWKKKKEQQQQQQQGLLPDDSASDSDHALLAELSLAATAPATANDNTEEKQQQQQQHSEPQKAQELVVSKATRYLEKVCDEYRKTKQTQKTTRSPVSSPNTTTREEDTTLYFEVYKMVARQYLQLSELPIFCMPTMVTLGKPYGLHFFEPRYRYMIAEAMQTQHPSPSQSQSSTAREQQQQQHNRQPVFIHAHNGGHLSKGTIATLVKVVQCNIFHGGEADVVLMPLSFVAINGVHVKPNTGNLYYASSCVRLGKVHTQKEIDRIEHSAEMEHRRQELQYLQWMIVNVGYQQE